MSRKIGLFLGAMGVILIPVITIIIAMQSRSTPPQGSPISDEGFTATPSGLKIKDERVGAGSEPAAKGQSATVNYTGKLMNGKQFDTSIGRAPFNFRIGSGEVIPGWDEGVVGMKVGSKRKLIVPSELAYGPNGKGSIPPNATLYFEIELMKLE